MKTRLERPNPTDWENIASLLALTISETFSKEGLLISHPSDRDDEIRQQIDVLDRDFQSNGIDEHCIIARADSLIIGIIAFGGLSQLISANLHIRGGQIREIKCAYVHPAFQKMGVGSTLFARILREMNKAGINEFCLDCGYSTAQKFWRRKLGDPTLVLRDYYGKNLDHMIWRGSVPNLVQESQ